MAKFSFYAINCSKFVGQDGNMVETDNVTIQISKRVNTAVMQGQKGEDYSVKIADLPYLFQSDVKFPSAVGNDTSARVSAVKDFLSKFIGKDCTAEEITKGKTKVLTYLEFN